MASAGGGATHAAGGRSGARSQESPQHHVAAVDHEHLARHAIAVA